MLQLLNINDPDISEATYLNVIHAKTAKLFEAATRLGAVLAGLPEKQETALAAYGKHLGTAFQLIDDILDYSSDASEMGKNLGDDLAEGKPTLPLILAMKRGSAKQSAVIRKAIEQGGREHIDAVLDIISQTNVLEESRELAEREPSWRLDNSIALMSQFLKRPWQWLLALRLNGVANSNNQFKPRHCISTDRVQGRRASSHQFAHELIAK